MGKADTGGLDKPYEPKQPKDSKSVTPTWTIARPVFSWDRPIEEIILEKVRHMRRGWQVQQHANIWGSVRKEAKSIIMAYEMVEDIIVKEMGLRAKIAAGRQERANGSVEGSIDAKAEEL